MVKKLLISKNTTSNIVFLDLNSNYLNDKTIRMDLNIAFRAIPIKRGLIQKKDYYVGSTGARVIFEAIGGKVTNYARGTSFNFDYETTYKRSQQSAVKMSPKIEVGKAANVELGEVGLNKDEERTFVAKFSGSERLLSDVNLGDRVEWELAIPEGQVIRDYLFGNLELFVESIWEKGKKQGQVVLHPDRSFFDPQRRLISGVKTTLVMLYKLFEKGIKIEDVEVSFMESN